MATQAYLWHYLVAGIVLLLAGTLAHVFRAVFNVLPDRLSDKPLMDLAISDGYDWGDRIFGTEYDDGGYYRLDSLRNWRNAAMSMLIGGWAVMLLAPGVAGLVAGAIDQALVWLWQLFLIRLGDVEWF